MKRVGYLYEKIYDMDNLKRAHENAKKGKGWYKEVKQVEANLDYYLKKLQDMLKNKTYKTSEYVMFNKVEGIKERKIYKLPYYPDRIAQWAVIQVIEPYLLKHFTADTYSAIPGRGVHKCLNKVKECMYHDMEECWYCLKFDIKHYYQSIDHDILKQKYRKLFKDSDLLWLLDEIIDSINTIDQEDLERLKEECDIKSNSIGIPIGNYLSQYSGNYYLSDFDHWLKESKHIKYCFCYMDDIVIFGKCKEKLTRLLHNIWDYLKRNLNLLLKRNYQIFPSYVRGVDFVGYRIFYKYTLLRKSTCKRLKEEMQSIACKCKHGEFMSQRNWGCFNSYMGMLKHCNGFRLYKKYFKPLECYVERFYKICIKGDLETICSVIS